MSKETISHYTLQLLLTQKRACLPTLGILYLQPQAAEIRSQEDKIIPPSYKVEFAPSDRISEEQLKSQLLKWDQMTEVTAENIVDRFTEKLRAGLLSGGVVIDGVGTLRNTEDGIEFTQETTSDNPFNPLPELSLTPVVRSEDEKKKAASVAQAATASTVASTVAATEKQRATEEEIEQSEVDNSKEDETDESSFSPLIPIIGILLILLLGFAMWFYMISDEENEEQASVEEQEIVEERLNVSPTGTEKDNNIADSTENLTENSINKDSVSQSEEDALSNEEKGDLMTEPEEVENIEGTETDRGTEEEEKEGEKNEIQNESEGKSKVEENTQEENNLSSDAEKSIAGNDIDTRKNVRKKSGDCIVIVGAFGVPENAERMEEKLRSKGWKVYSNVSVKLRKVGALVPCNRSELLSSMRELRRTIEPNAWIMKDN